MNVIKTLRLTLEPLTAAHAEEMFAVFKRTNYRSLGLLKRLDFVPAPVDRAYLDVATGFGDPL